MLEYTKSVGLRASTKWQRECGGGEFQKDHRWKQWNWQLFGCGNTKNRSSLRGFKPYVWEDIALLKRNRRLGVWSGLPETKWIKVWEYLIWSNDGSLIFKCWADTWKCLNLKEDTWFENEWLPREKERRRWERKKNERKKKLEETVGAVQEKYNEHLETMVPLTPRKEISQKGDCGKNWGVSLHTDSLLLSNRTRYPEIGYVSQPLL